MAVSFIASPSDIFTRVPPEQTLAAWRPFWATVSILFELQNSDIDDEHPEWRFSWIAGVALLRTIGHVLDKVDAKVSQRHENAIRSTWNGWKNDRTTHWIFWEFVEDERNNVLKSYTFGVTLDDNG